MVTLKVPRNRPPKYGIDFLEAILREQMTKYGIPIRYQNSTKIAKNHILIQIQLIDEKSNLDPVCSVVATKGKFSFRKVVFLAENTCLAQSFPSFFPFVTLSS